MSNAFLAAKVEPLKSALRPADQLLQFPREPSIQRSAALERFAYLHWQERLAL